MITLKTQTIGIFIEYKLYKVMTKMSKNTDLTIKKQLSLLYLKKNNINPIQTLTYLYKDIT